MFQKKDTISIILQVQVLTYTKIAEGKFFVEIKRKHHSYKTDSYETSEQLGFEIDKEFVFPCKFVFDSKKKSWKKKNVDLYIIKIKNTAKTKQIAHWEIDISDLYRKDTINKVINKQNEILGDIEVHLNITRGQVATKKFPPMLKNNVVEARKIPINPNLQARRLTTPNISSAMITAHRRSVSTIQKQSLPFGVTGTMESFTQECSSLAEMTSKYINDKPIISERLIQILFADKDDNINKTKAIQMILHSLIKFTTGKLEDKLFACFICLHIYIATLKTIFNEKESTILYDSFTQTFDNICSELIYKYERQIISGDITSVSTEIINWVTKMGVGRFYMHVINCILFAFATSFDSNSAYELCNNLGIRDQNLTDYLKENQNPSKTFIEASPFIEQITQILINYHFSSQS